MSDERKSVFVRLDPDLHARIKIYCAQNSLTLQDFFENAATIFMDYSHLMVKKEPDGVTFLFGGDREEEILSILRGIRTIFHDGNEEAQEP